MRFDELLVKTPKSLSIKIKDKCLWFPAKMCRDLKIHKNFQGSMVIPSWLYKEKFSREPSKKEAETIIERYKPIHIESVTSNKINDLRNGVAN